MPHWITVISAILTPIVAVLGIWIAHEQKETARRKLKLDLFDRREAVYRAARTAIGIAVTTSKFGYDSEIEYLAGTGGAKWLFKDDLANYLENDLWDRLADLIRVNGQLDGLQASPERTQLFREQSRVLSGLSAQYKVLDEKFLPYLKLD